MQIMRDRDVIQLGIGSLPSACVAALTDAGFKDLGVHTEMLNFGLMKLIESARSQTPTRRWTVARVYGLSHSLWT